MKRYISRIHDLLRPHVLLGILFIVSIVALLDLFHPGIFLGHDTPDHVARIANFYQALREGIIVPRWAANLNWGYGHPILMFLYPLPSYIASIFLSFGFSSVDSTKLVFAVSFLLSISAMYVWMKEQFGKEAGIIGALLYGFAPYRFVDLYVRGAIGEHVAFAFAPLIGVGLLRLARKQTIFSCMLVAFGWASLILAHNALSLMFFPILGVYGLYLLFFETKRPFQFLLGAVFSVFLGFGIASFFWVPAFFEGKYTLRDIVTRGEFAQRMVPWARFFSSSWEYGGAEMSRSLGILPWVGVFCGVILFIRTSHIATKWFLGGMIVLLLASLFLMTDAAIPIWRAVTLLQKFQFPWRILSITTLLAAIIGAAVISQLKPQTARYIILGAFILTVMTTWYMWKARGYMVKSEEYYSGIYNSTTDTGESSPIWSVRFMEMRPAAHLEVIDGSAKVTEGERSTTKRAYKVSSSVPTRLVENTLYFPGWTVSIDGIPASVEFQNPQYRGLMTFEIPPGVHDVMVSFGDTKLRQFANLASGVSIFIFFLGMSYFIILRKR